MRVGSSVKADPRPRVGGGLRRRALGLATGGAAGVLLFAALVAHAVVPAHAQSSQEAMGVNHDRRSPTAPNGVVALGLPAPVGLQ